MIISPDDLHLFEDNPLESDSLYEIDTGSLMIIPIQLYYINSCIQRYFHSLMIWTLTVVK